MPIETAPGRDRLFSIHDDLLEHFEAHSFFSGVEAPPLDIPEILSREIIADLWKRFNLIQNLELKHRYFMARHGKTQVNADGLIDATVDANLHLVTLLPEGVDEVEKNAAFARDNGILDSSCIVLCSDYRRSKESALLAANVLGAHEPVITRALRERLYGGFVKIPGDEFWRIERLDKENPLIGHHGVESVCDAMKRVTRLVTALEFVFREPQIFLLEAHHDLIQIAGRAFKRSFPGKYTSVGMLDNGQIFELVPNRGLVPVTPGRELMLSTEELLASVGQDQPKQEPLPPMLKSSLQGGFA